MDAVKGEQSQKDEQRWPSSLASAPICQKIKPHSVMLTGFKNCYWEDNVKNLPMGSWPGLTSSSTLDTQMRLVHWKPGELWPQALLRLAAGSYPPGKICSSRRGGFCCIPPMLTLVVFLAWWSCLLLRLLSSLHGFQHSQLLCFFLLVPGFKLQPAKTRRPIRLSHLQEWGILKSNPKSDLNFIDLFEIVRT